MTIKDHCGGSLYVHDIGYKSSTKAASVHVTKNRVCVCVCASAGLGRMGRGCGGTNPFMKPMYTDSRARAGSHGGFAWFLFAPPRPRLYKDRSRPLSALVGLYTYLYISCECVYVGVWLCLCAMLEGVSFFRNRIRKDVVLYFIPLVRFRSFSII